MTGRLIIALLLSVIAAAAQAKPWALHEQRIQNGYYRASGACEATEAREGIGACRCKADIVVPEFDRATNWQIESKLNDYFNKPYDKEGALICRGKAIDGEPADKVNGTYKNSYIVAFENESLIEIVQYLYAYEDDRTIADDEIYNFINKKTGDILDPKESFEEGDRDKAKAAIKSAIRAQGTKIKHLPEEDYTFYLKKDGGWHVLYYTDTGGVIDVPFTKPELFNDPILREAGKVEAEDQPEEE